MAKQRNQISLISDAIGIAHFIVANIVLLLEFTTEIFGEDRAGRPGVESSPPGIELIYNYIDAPIHALFKLCQYPFSKDNFYLDAQLVIILSSILYATLARKLLRFLANS